MHAHQTLAPPVMWVQSGVDQCEVAGCVGLQHSRLRDQLEITAVTLATRQIFAALDSRYLTLYIPCQTRKTVQIICIVYFRKLLLYLKL